MICPANNYFLSYHQLVLARITSGQTQLYPHQVEALLAIYQKACKGEMDSSYREAALILAGVGPGKTGNVLDLCIMGENKAARIE